MAKQTLPVNFLDDILNASMNGKRQYVLTDNGNGTHSLDDVTVYDQVGSVLGQAILNAICAAVNASVDQARIVETEEDLQAVTEAGYVAGAQAVGQLIKNISFPNGDGFFPDVQDGVSGYNTDPARGADTFHPFRSSLIYVGKVDTNYQDTVDCTGVPNYKNMTADDFIYVCTYVSGGSYSNSNKSTSATITKTYDAEKGILTIKNGNHTVTDHAYCTTLGDVYYLG